MTKVSPTNEKEPNNDGQQELKVYARRWLVLFSFAFLSGCNGYQWIEYSVISDKVQHFYGITENDVNWLSVCWMVSYLLLIIPANMLVDYLGMYKSVLMGAVVNAIGAWLKVFTAKPNLYWLTLVSNIIASIAQLNILAMPSLVAANWFDVRHIGTATAIGVFGNQVGIGVGFFIPPMIVKYSNETTKQVDEESMRNAFFVTGGLATAALLGILLCFRDHPPTPPSAAHAAANDAGVRLSSAATFSTLIRHRGFVLLVLSYGLISGSYWGYSTLLNSIILDYAGFKGDEESIGDVGLSMTLSGIVGALVAGPILDKTQKYKIITIIFYLAATIMFGVCLGCLMWGQLWALYVANILLGFFMTGYLPIGFEFAAEITYPITENTTAGLLNQSGQLFGIALVFGGQAIINSSLGANGAMAMFGAGILIGAVLNMFIPEILVRHTADAEPEFRRRATSAASGIMQPEDHHSQIQHHS